MTRFKTIPAVRFPNRWQSYECYKETDQLWLNQIPKHWDMMKIKYLFIERSEKGHADAPLLVASQNMGVVPKGVYGNRTVEATKDLHLLKLVEIGDFVISLRSFQGGIEYAYYQGIISPAYTVMKSNGAITNGYFRHLAKSKTFIELLQMCVTGIREGQNIDYSKLKNFRLPIPSHTEQEQIVRYLDWKQTKINKLIKAIHGKASVDPKILETYPHSVLALLIEYRTSLISSVVTGKIDVSDVVILDSEIEYEALAGDIETIIDVV